MLTKLETLETQAKFIGTSLYKFTPYDTIMVAYHAFWDEGYTLRYFFNGVEYEREYILEKIPGYFEDGHSWPDGVWS